MKEEKALEEAPDKKEEPPKEDLPDKLGKTTRSVTASVCKRTSAHVLIAKEYA